jgi:hypothetical protein
MQQLKKIISILLIAVFFTAQYARQLAYLECKLAVLSAADAVNCDCEKQTGIDKVADDGIPASKSHTHVSVDEFFSNPANESSTILMTASFIKPEAIYTKAEAAGNAGTPFRPPGA